MSDRSAPTEALPPADAARQLVALLAEEGVTHLFMNPGTDTAPVQEALAAARAGGEPHPRSVLCVHEHVALSSAIAHHMLTGRPQAVMVHVDAGTLNLGGSLHNAQRNRTPVVVFAGRAPYTVATDVPGHRDATIHWPQEQLDQPAVMRAYGKWTMEVPRGRELGVIVRRAFQVAQAPPQGMAYVMLPREALMDPAGPSPSRLRPPFPPAPDPTGLAEMAERLAGAERPVIVSARTGAHPENVAILARLADLLGAPVLDQRDRLNLPSDHPLYAGTHEEPLRQADAILLLDVEVPWIPAFVSPRGDAAILQIDVDPAKSSMPTWSFPVDLALTADTRLALPALERELERLATPERRRRWEARRERVAAELAEVREGWRRRASSDRPEDAADAALAALDRSLPRSAVVLEEAVTNRPALVRQIGREPGRYFSSGAPSLGWAVGGALGAKLARPEAPVVAICGDGSFQFSVPNAALWSARRAGAPFVAVVLNNGAYRASRLPVVNLYPEGAATRGGDFPETDLRPSLDHTLLARACGGDGAVVESAAELGDALAWALETVDCGGCAVLDVRLPAP